MRMPVLVMHHRDRLLLLAAFLGMAGITGLSLSLNGSAVPHHTPPTFEISKLGGSTFSARDQP